MKFNNIVSKMVWNDRYRKNGESLEENLRRVAKTFAHDKDQEEEFSRVMDNGYFFPAGRSMSNAGIGEMLTYNNCYVCPIVPDDMNGIFEAVKLGAITHKSGGGIGYDFSYLRPNGSPTSNDAVASGPVSFMHVFNTQTATIQAGSRRGANMGVLNIYHPDIEEFISAKSYEAGILNHFNLSVMIDDDFMGAVNDDSEIYLHWPVYDDCGRIIKDEKEWKIKKKVRARDIWDKIMRKAYESGEPGVLFYDNMNKDNTTNYKENIISTNPCFSGRMKLLTTEGYKTFKELSDRKSVNIINGKGNVSKDNKVWCSGTKKVVRVMFTNGNNVECTPDHKFLLANGIEWCEAQNLQNKAVKTYPGRGAICCAVVDIGEMEVYDFSEKDEHSGVVEGYVVHNCGEYVAGMVYGADNTGKQIKSADFGGACNLGSLFIHNFVHAPFTNDAFFDYEALKSSVRTAVHFLDNVIDVNRFPNPVYENYQKNFRTIGLGITGLADACAMLGMPYDSDRAIEFADYLMEQIAATAYKTSIEMAKENGPFPFFEKEGYTNSGFIQKHLRSNPQLWGDIVNDIEKYGIRNARMISVAPVGTLSLTYGNNCSSGVEPIFQTSYKRRVHVGGQEEKDVQTVDLKDYAYSIWENTKDKIDMPEDILFKTALNISVDSHIKMLRTVSYHVDMSVSKTINVPAEYTFEQTKEIYDNVWRSGIKGCTIFRPSEIRPGVLVSSDSKPVEKKEERKWGDVLSCSDDLIMKKRRIMGGCGSIHVIAGFDPVTGEVRETYFSKGSTGGCSNFMTGLSRAISMLGRAGVSIEKIKDQLDSTGACPSYATRRATKKDTSAGSCCPMAIGNALMDMYKEVLGELSVAPHDRKKDNCEECIDPQAPIELHPAIPAKRCPECGELLDMEGGCIICRSCGYTKCE